MIDELLLCSNDLAALFELHFYSQSPWLKSMDDKVRELKDCRVESWVEPGTGESDRYSAALSSSPSQSFYMVWCVSIAAKLARSATKLSE